MLTIDHVHGTRSVRPAWLCYELGAGSDRTGALYHQWCWFRWRTLEVTA